MTEQEFFDLLDAINRDLQAGRRSVEEASAEREALIDAYTKGRAA